MQQLLLLGCLWHGATAPHGSVQFLVGCFLPYPFFPKGQRGSLPISKVVAYGGFYYPQTVKRNIPRSVESVGLESVRTSFRSPWQNGVAERWVGSCRRDLLDHVIALNEKHLKRLLSEYVRYYHEDRTHLGLNKETPSGRLTEIPTQHCRVVSRPRL